MKKLLLTALMTVSFIASANDCNTFEYPQEVNVIKDGELFFYTELTLANNTRVKNGYEFDGDRWEPVEHERNAKQCKSQWEYFEHATMNALTARVCDGDNLSYPTTDNPSITQYKIQLAEFCQASQDFSY